MSPGSIIKDIQIIIQPFVLAWYNRWDLAEVKAQCDSCLGKLANLMSRKVLLCNIRVGICKFTEMLNVYRAHKFNMNRCLVIEERRLAAISSPMGSPYNREAGVNTIPLHQSWTEFVFDSVSSFPKLESFPMELKTRRLVGGLLNFKFHFVVSVILIWNSCLQIYGQFRTIREILLSQNSNLFWNIVENLISSDQRY